MDRSFYTALTEKSLANKILDGETCERILTSPDVELLPLLDAAYQIRKKFWGREVIVHIINNAQNGFCPEDCHYCAQAKSSQANIEEYPLKSDAEIIAEARAAYAAGAYRYCMVFAGRGPSPKRVAKLAELIRTIKAEYPQYEICVSAGLVDAAGAKTLKSAGLDRLNHNLNTSRSHYPQICTTHTFDDRLNTLKSAKAAGLQLCSGVIAGMGENHRDLIDVALHLRESGVVSIPVNFLVPVEGNTLTEPQGLSPEYCLRILCLFRFLNPSAEIRASAGREGHLRSMEVLALYPANSLFLQGYLNTKGSSNAKTLRMIRDAGFTIKSEVPLGDLLAAEGDEAPDFIVDDAQTLIKNVRELRPTLPTPAK